MAGPRPQCGPRGEYAPLSYSPVTLDRDLGTSQEPTLLRLAAQHGWDSPELRRLCTLGYSAGPVWPLLAALPPPLRDLLLHPVPAPAPAPTACAAHASYDCGGGGGGGGGWDEAREVFGAAEERALRAMEEDGEVGLLVVDYDPASQRRTRVRISPRYAALRGAAQPALIAADATAAPLPATGRDLLAAVLHAAAVRRGGGADVTQYVRAAGAAGGARLLREDSRTRFDARGRVRSVRSAARRCAPPTALPLWRVVRTAGARL